MNRTGLLFVTGPTQREQAMEWLLRLEGDDVDESVVAEWSAWYHAEASNKTAFDTLQAFREQCDGLMDDPARAARLKKLAAAPERQVVPHASRVMKALREHRPRVRLLAIGAASAACLLAAITLGPRLFEKAPGDVMNTEAVAHAPMVRETLLPDGSKVELAPKSAIEVDYTESQRTLALSSGEGYFSVAPNKARPFVVKVNGLNVRAVGTEFNIRCADERTVVTVTKGTVDVYPDSARTVSPVSAGPVAGGVRVTAGNEVSWVGKVPMVASIDAAHAATWRQGRLEYIQEPLSSVIADVNRYSTRQIVISDKEVGAMSFTGTVLTDDTGEWLRSLPTVFPVKIVSDSQRDTLELRSRTGAPVLR